MARQNFFFGPLLKSLPITGLQDCTGMHGQQNVQNEEMLSSIVLGYP